MLTHLRWHCFRLQPAGFGSRLQVRSRSVLWSLGWKGNGDLGHSLLTTVLGDQRPSLVTQAYLRLLLASHLLTFRWLKQVIQLSPAPVGCENIFYSLLVHCKITQGLRGSEELRRRAIALYKESIVTAPKDPKHSSTQNTFQWGTVLWRS